MLYVHSTPATIAHLSISVIIYCHLFINGCLFLLLSLLQPFKVPLHKVQGVSIRANLLLILITLHLLLTILAVPIIAISDWGWLRRCALAAPRTNPLHSLAASTAMLIRGGTERTAVWRWARARAATLSVGAACCLIIDRHCITLLLLTLLLTALLLSSCRWL